MRLTMLRCAPKRSLLGALGGSVLLLFLYFAWHAPGPEKPRLEPDNPVSMGAQRQVAASNVTYGLDPGTSPIVVVVPEPECHSLALKESNIETADIYPKLNFNAPWIERREFWNDKMEKRYKHRRKEIWPKLPLKVIVMPHSHNDPGWLKTYEGYFNQATKAILNNVVHKLMKYKQLTFVWTEMAFLQLWWENADSVDKESLKKLVEEGRFEVLTGGWVMTDEANVHLFAMVDQLIEGHQWLLSNLGFRPKSSWSVDPFGHGGTFPYVLKSSGLDGMVIMRIHYAWKEYFAIEQTGDFMWQQRWDSTGKGSILCHNFPYDIYSIKGSCGPNAQTCVQFNFAVNPSAYSEYSSRNIPINQANLRERAETLLDQYGKTGSLFPHNVVLVPLGEDFLYSSENELDKQYANYKMLIQYINDHKDEYHAEVRFGTLSDYFNEVRARTTRFDSLTGDFFVYSDIFTDGVPAYWSGYYTTRPYMKQMSRELENNLRSAEILYTLSYQGARQKSHADAVAYFRNAYFELVQARRHLALFQHHDAITGTSKQFVMHDYGIKLFDGLIKTRGIQRTAIQYLMGAGDKPSNLDQRFLSSDYVRHDFESQPKSLSLDLKTGDQFIVVFNSLANVKHDVISFFVERTQNSICIQDPFNKLLPYQLNPTWSVGDYFRLDTHLVEVVFPVKLEPLSLAKFKVYFCSRSKNDSAKHEPTQVFCIRCAKGKEDKEMLIESIPDGSIVIENAHFSLVFDEDTKLLSTITHKATGVVENVQITFGAYPTMPFRSGAYLFKPDPQKPENVPVFDGETLREAVIVSGSIFSELSLVFEGPKRASFVHTVRLYHTVKGSPMGSGLYIENNIDFGEVENYRDIDFFMRLKTGIKNGGQRGPPTFYTDQNGFQMQKRVKASNISIEGNYFPITTMTYLEDEKSRVSLIVDHAQAAASWQQGWLELMVDRRSSYDDSRGMGEGILDNRPTSHKYWLLFEPQNHPDDFKGGPQENIGSTLPSAVANQLSRYLNYPSIQYIGNLAEHEKLILPRKALMPKSYPCDLHLFNFRTLPTLSSPDLPSNEALLILHNQTPDCTLAGIGGVTGCLTSASSFTRKDFLDFGNVAKVKHFARTTLTGNSPAVKEDMDKGFNLEPMVLDSVKVQF